MESTTPSQATEPAAPTTDVDTTSSVPEARTPVAPTLPPDPGYRSRLGQYADFVLGDALVPHGSPEHLQFLKSCIESAGFKVDIADGGLMAAPPPEQAAHYDEAQSQCEQAAMSSGLVAEYDEATDEELAAWYEALLLTHQCLADHGYPAAPPPSLDSYIEAQGRNWHPYDAIMDTTAVEAVCPQDLVVLFERLASSPEP
jgi:hypothetical protein